MIRGFINEVDSNHVRVVVRLQAQIQAEGVHVRVVRLQAQIQTEVVHVGDIAFFSFSRYA